MFRFFHPIAISILFIVMPGTASAGLEEARKAYEQGDFDKAFEEFLPLARKKDPESLFIIGQMYRLGQGVDVDNKRARKWYAEAAKKGHSEAQYQLGLIYQNGDGTRVNLDKARDWFESAADQGNAAAVKVLQELALTHKPEALDLVAKGKNSLEANRRSSAKASFESACKLGLPEGCYRLARVYYDRRGQDPSQHTKNSAHLFKKACASPIAESYPESCLYLGHMNEAGDGVPINLSSAEDYFKQVCDAGVAEGCVERDVVGHFIKGQAAFEDKDYGTAIDSMSIAAEAGRVRAQFLLAEWHCAGTGLAKPDIESCLNWLGKAAALGDKEAKKLLPKVKDATSGDHSTAHKDGIRLGIAKELILSVDPTHEFGSVVKVGIDLGIGGSGGATVGVVRAGEAEYLDGVEPIKLPGTSGSVTFRGLMDGDYEIVLKRGRKLIASAPATILAPSDSGVSEVASAIPCENHKADARVSRGEIEERLNANDLASATQSTLRYLCSAPDATSKKLRELDALTRVALGADGKSPWTASQMISKFPSLGLPVLEPDALRVVSLLSIAATEENAELRCLSARLLVTSALQGHTRSQVQIGNLIRTGAACDWIPDAATSFQMYQTAATSGAWDAKAQIGAAYLLGKGVQADMQKGLSILEETANAPFPEAAFVLGSYYLTGQGVSRDRNKAIQWLETAADGGMRDAEPLLAELTMEEYDALFADSLATDKEARRKLEQLLNKAISLFRSAAENGNAHSAYRLANILTSMGSRTEGQEMMRRAADAGHPDAMAVLGKELYGSKAGAEWLRKAAEAGSSYGRTYYGLALVKGEGVAANPGEGISWLERAAMVGDVRAMDILARLYLNGDGVKQSDGQASVWAQRAVAAGSEASKELTLEGKVENFMRNQVGADTYLWILAESQRPGYYHEKGYDALQALDEASMMGLESID